MSIQKLNYLRLVKSAATLELFGKSYEYPPLWAKGE